MSAKNYKSNSKAKDNGEKHRIAMTLKKLSPELSRQDLIYIARTLSVSLRTVERYVRDGKTTKTSTGNAIIAESKTLLSNRVEYINKLLSKI